MEVIVTFTMTSIDQARHCCSDYEAFASVRFCFRIYER